jgi:3-phenylpropionate/cinnamic acid dioxygenase small subunit
VSESTEEQRRARQDIADVLVRYASGIDRREWDLFRSCFADACEADYGDIGTWNGADELTKCMREMHEPLGPTLHRITNQAVELGGDDEATARSYVDALVTGPDNGSVYRIAGYYDDELARDADGWKITRRRFTMVDLRSGTTDEPGS